LLRPAEGSRRVSYAAARVGRPCADDFRDQGSKEGTDGEQAEDQGQRPCPFGDGVARYAASVRAAQRAAPARAQVRLRAGAVRGLLGALGREGDPELRHSGGGCEREGDHDAGGAAGVVGEGARHDGFEPGVASVAAGVDRRAGAALRLLPERDDDPGGGSPQHHEEPDRGPDPHGDERPPLPLRHLPADPDRDQAGRGRDGEGRQVMTGLLHERQLSRKTFLKGGGALIVGLSLTGAARAFDDPKAASPSHIGGVAGPPDPSQIDTWIAIHADNTASIYTGRVNLGQGTPNGLLMIAGEELDMDLGQLTFVEADSNVTPDTGNTVGSSSITSAGPRVRAGAASAKQVLLGL